MPAGTFDPLSPEVAYAIKGNIKYPGTQQQATIAEGVAQARMNDGYSPVTTTVPGGSIKVAT
jgi:hypothetical protein